MAIWRVVETEDGWCVTDAGEDEKSFMMWRGTFSGTEAEALGEAGYRDIHGFTPHNALDGPGGAPIEPYRPQVTPEMVAAAGRYFVEMMGDEWRPGDPPPAWIEGMLEASMLARPQKVGVIGTDTTKTVTW